MGIPGGGGSTGEGLHTHLHGQRVARHPGDILSHLGRPKDGPEDKFSLGPVAPRLSELPLLEELPHVALSLRKEAFSMTRPERENNGRMEGH